MKRAVLMIIDGLRADLVTPELTPHLWAAAGHGRLFRNQRSVFPSATRVNSASIATGCLPRSHGLAGNAIALDEGAGLAPVSVGPAEFRERWRRTTGKTLLRPTLSERLSARGGAVVYSNSSPGAAHMQDPDGHGWLFHRSGSHTPGFKPVADAAHPDVSYDGAGDARITERLCAALAAPGGHPLYTLWICEPDHSQHLLELGSTRHREVVARADACVGRVCTAVDRLREAGDDVLLVLCSDHGHETVDEIIPVTDLLVDAGMKAGPESSDVVLASSGMGALVYLSPEAAARTDIIADWLRHQPWCAQVVAGAELASLGQQTDTALALAFSMAKRDTPNRHGVMGLGHVAADPFTSTNTPGHGQHGGLGPYETNPALIVTGGEFTRGVSDHPSSVIDIAPTILRHLQIPADGMDGRALPYG